MSGYITVNVDVDIELEDIDTDDLVEELDRRGVETDLSGDLSDDIRLMYEKYVLGKPIDEELRNFFWKSIGKMV